MIGVGLSVVATSYYRCFYTFSIVVVLEEQKLGIQKESSELRNTLREVEKARLDARRELQELRRQVIINAAALHVNDQSCLVIIIKYKRISLTE